MQTQEVAVEKQGPSELEATLAQFIGTSGYHRVTFMPSFVATDGVKYLCETAGAFWLTDIIASYQPKIARKGRAALEFQVWTLKRGTRKKSIAFVECRRDSGDKPIVRQRIGYTDFPLDEVTIWVVRQETESGGGLLVAMLPSEY